jgi:glucose/arabinose dehydrogenase
MMNRTHVILAAAMALPLLAGTAAFAAPGTSGEGGNGGSDAPAVSDDFSRDVLTAGLDNPFEVIYGPDNWLWVTERDTGKVTKVNPADGSKTTILTIDEVLATPTEHL